MQKIRRRPRIQRRREKPLSILLMERCSSERHDDTSDDWGDAGTDTRADVNDEKHM